MNAGDGAQYNDAAVHTGTGDQYFFHGDTEDTHRFLEHHQLKRDGSAVRAEWLRTVRQRFVCPPGHDERALRARLGDETHLVLTGEPGWGREALAQTILVPEGEEKSGLRQINAEDGFWDRDTPSAGERLLLDLRGELTDPLWPVRLRSFAGQVAIGGARLIVLLDRRTEKDLPEDLRGQVVPAARPDPWRVLSSHMEAVGLATPADEGGERLHAWLDTAGVGEIADVARRAGDALPPGSDVGAVTEWIEAVLGAGHADIDDALDASDGRTRAVLISVAFLEGAHLEDIAAARARLSEHTGGAPEDLPIERSSFTAELRGSDATVTDRRARFADPWRAQVLREVLWDGHPHLQHHVGAWVDRCVTGDLLPAHLRDQVARNWAEQVLRARRPGPLLERARGWAIQGHPQARLLLGAAFADRSEGHRVRRRVYEWSRDRDLPVRLAHMLIHLCAEDMVTTHPDPALVRLRHLSAHSRSEVADHARRRLRGLVSTDPSLFRAQLHALTTVFWDPTRRARDVHVELFADVTRTDVLDAVGADGRQVVDGLIALLERRPESLSALLAPWLAQPEHRLRWLVAAVHETGHMGELYALALRMPTGSLGPDELRRHAREIRTLLSLIDRAQGLDLGAPPVKETP
ncbi:hypothetical protein [Nocardiopsis xinjiangensis]|uniref:hypothetical protein n=1 Tax=Nocardiopsis xinjiangensis TaxID=124285 RepID=UPI00034CF077|nr:hypothetical protein [Nocardiopsis xinjiangensis]